MVVKIPLGPLTHLLDLFALYHPSCSPSSSYSTSSSCSTTSWCITMPSCCSYLSSPTNLYNRQAMRNSRPTPSTSPARILYRVTSDRIIIDCTFGCRFSIVSLSSDQFTKPFFNSHITCLMYSNFYVLLDPRSTQSCNIFQNPYISCNL